ncbi:hypothetical protein H4R33_000470 [Dimargaris cristalligena]|nr:hypothetical protein H4R33_000470 [Dimargaris cristalligena]
MATTTATEALTALLTSTTETMSATATATGSPINNPTFFYHLTTPGMLMTLSAVLLMLVILIVAISGVAGIETPSGLKQSGVNIKKKAQ